jgi:hypothetical protein
MKRLNSFSILFTFILLLLTPILAAAVFDPEACEIPYQINNSDHILIGTVSEIDKYKDYINNTISVDEWLYNPLPEKIIIVRTTLWVEEARFTQNESVLLMLNDQIPDKGVFYMSFGEVGKHPISVRDLVIKELKSQGKLEGEDQVGIIPEIKIKSYTLDTAHILKNITGTAKNIPQGYELWILVYSTEKNKYYPISKADIQNGEWTIPGNICIKDKFWAIHEKRSALSRAIRDKGVYLLPARFDDTEIEGIPKTTAYIDISKKTPRDFSEFVIGKLEIPLKQKDIDSNLPDIKVKVNYVAFVGESVAFHVLCINVSNHGNYPVFLKYPRIELKNGLHLPIRKDDFYGNTISEIGKLEPGDSFEIMSNPANYANYMNELDFVMVYDKIGRKFKSSSEELNKAVNNLNEGIISYNKSVSE